MTVEGTRIKEATLHVYGSCDWGNKPTPRRQGLARSFTDSKKLFEEAGKRWYRFGFVYEALFPVSHIREEGGAAWSRLSLGV